MAGRLYAGPGIFDGLLKPPVILFASFFNMSYIIYDNYGNIMAPACGLWLGA
jgi:hypothetical protein